MTATDPLQPVKNHQMLRLLLPIFAIFFAGCSDYCENRFQTVLTEIDSGYHDAPQVGIDRLRRTLWICSIPEGGVYAPRSPTHAAEVHLILGDLEAASQALTSGDYTMSDLQSYGLWEFAVLTDNLDAAKLLIDVGVNPDIRHPAVNTTVLMIATWSKSFAVEKMQLLVDAGVDPLALTESDGMSALDFAMAEGNLDAITKMLEWIDAAGPESYDLVRRAIDGGEQEGDEYVDVLRGWLSEREAPQTQASE